MSKRKRYELTIDDIQGALDRISLVTEPAIEVDFFYFSADNRFKFKIEDEEQRIVTGPAMIPDLDIGRRDEITGEIFDVWFSKETVRKCAELYFKNSDINSTNIEHGEVGNSIYEGITTIESWFIDIENGKTGGKNYGDNINDGTWMVSQKIDNDDVWEDFIKTGFVKGFSIEGTFIQNFMKNKFRKDKISSFTTRDNINRLKEIDKMFKDGVDESIIVEEIKKFNIN